jgi:DNA-binding response OmpR family regulator
MANNIFVIDDDVELTVLLEEFLSSHGYHVLIFNNPLKALDALLKKSHLLCDLVILDIMMPELDGFQVLRKIRESSNVPVIMLSAKGKVADRVVGLELGADDYLAKPFEPQELLARIQSILRRVSSSNAMIDIVEFDGLSVNKIKQEVLVDGSPINLSTAEMEALMLFVDNANAPLSRDFLVENLRGIEWQTCDRSVDVLVSRLRNKLGESPSRTRFIITVHGLGYRFVGVKKNN